jgi:RNA polymerase sigma-70 factor (ECF subfamily)
LLLSRSRLPSMLSQSTAVDPSSWLAEYGDYLYRYALSRLRDPDAAEEVVQETMVAGLKNVQQYTGKGNERAWLLGILKKKIIDFFRQRNRNPMNTDDDSGNIADLLFDESGHWKKEIRSAIRQSLDSLDREEFWKILRNCLASLPTRQSDVFTLRVMNDESAEVICKDLEISSSNYWVILHRARIQLSSCMKQRWFLEST